MLTPLPTSRWPQKLCWKAQVTLREQDLWGLLRELPRLPLFPLWKPQQILPHRQLVLGHARNPFATAQAQTCGAEDPPQAFSPRAGMPVEEKLLPPQWGLGSSSSEHHEKASRAVILSPSHELPSYTLPGLTEYRAHWTPTYTPRNYTAEIFMSWRVFLWWQCHQNHLGEIAWSVHQPAQRAAGTVLLVAVLSQRRPCTLLGT